MSLYCLRGITVAELSLYKELLASGRSFARGTSQAPYSNFLRWSGGSRNAEAPHPHFECGASHLLFIGLPDQFVRATIAHFGLAKLLDWKSAGRQPEVFHIDWLTVFHAFCPVNPSAVYGYMNPSVASPS